MRNGLIVDFAGSKKERDGLGLSDEIGLIGGVEWTLDKVDSEGVLNLLVTSEKKFIGVVKIIDVARFSDVGKDW